MTGAPIAIGELLPHSSRARLVRRVLAHDGRQLMAEAVFTPDYPACEPEGVPAFVGIEIGAQALAALHALGATTPPGTRPTPGFVVRVHDAEFACTHLPVGVPIAVTAVIDASAGALVQARVVVEVGGATAVTANVSTYLPNGEPRS